MNLKSFVTVVFFLFLSPFLAGQNKGSLTITVNGNGVYEKGKTINYTYRLIKNDSVYRNTASFDLDYRWETDSLPVGVYTFKIIADSVDFATFNHIKVDSLKMNEYDFNMYHHSYPTDKHSENDTIKDDIQKIEVSLNTLYGNNTWHETIHKNYNELCSGELAFNFYSPVAKHYSIGAKIGGQYYKTGFYNDTSRYLGNRTLSKYYSSLIVTGGLINRFTFYNNKLVHKDGLKLDLGIVYNFPLSFKQVVRADDNTKIITRHIHRYNDFSVVARLAYKYIGIQAEYHIFNFLRSAYTETPSLRAGIVFFIPVPVD
jgi:hypothetical protein